MRLVIADTGPVNYLILIGHIELLQALFEKRPLPYGFGLPIARPGSMCATFPSANLTTLRKESTQARKRPFNWLPISMPACC